ncbi:MAG: hypothetical protein JWO36_1574 [Myxococcales bacterium]|nr:hypothetical protein [Myxococcales bacterium]
MLPKPPQLAVISDGDAPIGAFFLGRQRIRRSGVFASDALFLNATGTPRHDELTIEHNGILSNRHSMRSLASIVDLLPGQWHELFLPAINKLTFEDLEAVPGYRIKIDKQSPAPYVDLDKVRKAKDGYVSLLGSSTRTQLRRSRRVVGEIKLEIATGETQAMDIYGEMIHLHARRWNALGKSGAFADPWFEQFHRRLIINRLAHGEIQLARARAGDQTIGCLYNLVFRGRVLFYQSGLASHEDSHVKPGFLTHAAAIEHNAMLGHAVYDLLGGEGRYKQQLSTNETHLVWARIQRPMLRFSIEDRLRTAKQKFVAARPKLASPPA